MTECLDFWLKLAQLIGIPVAIVIYGLNKRRERLDREYGTYDALDEKYIEYLVLCLENPDLDIADTPAPLQTEPSAEQEHRERVAFSILIAILERAYLMYKDKSAAVRRKQWAGWRDYAEEWFGRDNFRRAWDELKEQFDRGFLEFMEDLKAQGQAG